MKIKQLFLTLSLTSCGGIDVTVPDPAEKAEDKIQDKIDEKVGKPEPRTGDKVEPVKEVEAEKPVERVVEKAPVAKKYPKIDKKNKSGSSGASVEVNVEVNVEVGGGTGAEYWEVPSEGCFDSGLYHPQTKLPVVYHYNRNGNGSLGIAIYSAKNVDCGGLLSHKGGFQSVVIQNESIDLCGLADDGEFDCSYLWKVLIANENQVFIQSVHLGE